MRLAREVTPARDRKAGLIESSARFAMSSVPRDDPAQGLDPGIDPSYIVLVC